MNDEHKIKRVCCPICSKISTWQGNPLRPFCSKACKDKDLGKWASEEYRIVGSDSEENDTNGFMDRPHEE